MKHATHMPDGQTATLLLNWKTRTDIFWSEHKARESKRQKINHCHVNMSENTNEISSLHPGGNNTRQLATSGFKEFLVMHIPRTTFCSTSWRVKSWELSSCEERGDNDDVILKEGARINWALNNSWPETNLTPL